MHPTDNIRHTLYPAQSSGIISYDGPLQGKHK